MIINSMEGYQNHKWFEITEEAKNQIEKLLEKNPGKYAVSLAVLGGGCAGFKYEWGFADTKESIDKDDHVEDWHTGRFVVDETSMLYVAGTKIDWVEETFGSQFEISNPNSSSSCGCGESFGV
jgi:iron-sulfur cluster insertion protein